MIKARPCAGDARAGEALVAEIAPFVWRKHLDFAALADVHDMKRQMQTYRGQSDIAVEGHNVKIGRGGIREIEFFAQTQQLIAGGRHPRIAGAADAGSARTCWPRATGSPLRRATKCRRPIDSCGGSSTGCRWSPTNRPMRCPTSVEAVERFARFFGYESRAAFAGDLLGHLNIVQGHYGKLFEGDPAGTAQLPAADYGAGPDDPRLLEHLATLGFKKPTRWRRPCSNGWSATIACSGSRRRAARSSNSFPR